MICATSKEGEGTTFVLKFPTHFSSTGTASPTPPEIDSYAKLIKDS